MIHPPLNLGEKTEPAEEPHNEEKGPESSKPAAGGEFVFMPVVRVFHFSNL